MANLLYDALFLPHTDSTHVFLYLENGEALTYQKFLQRTSQLAHTLVSLGVKPGDRVAMQVEKSPEALMLYAACVQSGAIFLPLNTAYTSHEVDYFISDSEPHLLVCDAQNTDGLQLIADKYNVVLKTLNADGSGSLMNDVSNSPLEFEAVERGADDLAAFLYTSGTTGRSKGAMLSHNNLLSNAQSLVEYWKFTKDDKLIHALPIFHTHGLFVATNTLLLAGGSIIFLAKFNAESFIKELPNASAMMGVPTFYTRLLAEPSFDQTLVKHMRLFVSGSAPLLAETHIQFEQRTGHKVLERYGMTETNMSTSNPYRGERKPGTVGLPLPNVDIKICNPESGAELEQGEIGVLEVRGPNVFQGYWRMPEKTAEELRTDGFFITGDLACIDEDGYIQIVGRSKDLIITGGYNVYPKEVELLLDQQDGILESAVIGVPHADFGEAVVAVLVAQKGKTVDLNQTLQAIQTDLARFKLPKKLLLIDELPRNAMGKVQKNQLRDRYSKVLMVKK